MNASENTNLSTNLTSVDTANCVRIVALVLIIFISPIAVVGNVIVIAGPLVTSHLRSSSNVYITLIAATDLLIGLVLMPLVFARYLIQSLNGTDLDSDYFAQHETACKALLMVYTLQYVSFNLLVFMMIDRGFSINCPIYHKKHCSSIKCPLFIFITVYSIWIIFSTAYFFRFIPGSCTMLTSSVPLWWKRVFMHYNFVVALVVCVCVSIQLLIALERINKKSALRRKSSAIMSKDRRFGGRVAAVLALVFVLLYVPTLTFSVAPKAIWFRYIAELCRFLNSISNAFIYAGIRKVNRTVYVFFLKNWPWNWRNVNRILNRKRTIHIPGGNLSHLRNSSPSPSSRSYSTMNNFLSKTPPIVSYIPKNTKPKGHSNIDEPVEKILNLVISEDTQQRESKIADKESRFLNATTIDKVESGSSILNFSSLLNDPTS